MKKLMYSMAISFGLLLSSCGNLAVSHSSKLFKIKQGMTESEVQQILGKPDYRRFHADMEEWEYHKVPIIGIGSVVIVGFKRGRVVHLDSFIDENARAADVNVKVDSN